MCFIVATKHGGSLKAEHGTGRNVAPYVEMEWGSKAYDLMWEIKGLFDPDFVLNPGVILNRDPHAHVRFLKPSPPANPLVNRCIECGFCESNCPSKDTTLTPRQRITVYKEMYRLEEMNKAGLATPEDQKRLADFQASWSYDGEATCAADGMCQEKCPVKINTGELIKHVRAEKMQEWKKATGVAKWVADNFGLVTAAVPPFLNTVNMVHGVLGPGVLGAVSGFLNKASGNYIPAWNMYMPKGAAPLKEPTTANSATTTTTRTKTENKVGVPRQVVYAPSCVTRMMGPSRSDTETESVHEKLLNVFEKAGYEVIYPKGLSASCCGMMFNSRGFKDAANAKCSELEASLLEASQGGKIPIVMDTSPCLMQVKQSLSSPDLRFSLYEPVEFIDRFLTDKLEWSKKKPSVAIHVPCSSKKMGIEKTFMRLAERCADKVTPSGIPCCGMAGDRGMRYPELTGSSLQHLNLPSDCKDGYSTSRTCEMSLSNHSGIDFRGLVYLVDECTEPKKE
jgi:D-lactate dehydrogenase